MKTERALNSDPQFRFIRTEEENLPALEGYAALFDVETDIGPFTESVAPGAFTESLKNSDDVRALFNHDPSMVLGRTKADTLELKEDSKGLLSTIYPPNTQLGRDLVESINRGDISQMSFGFFIEAEEREERDDGKFHYTITRARLFDVSPVTFPAYEQTEIGIMSRAARRKEELPARVRRVDFDVKQISRLALKKSKLKLYI